MAAGGVGWGWGISELGSLLGRRWSWETCLPASTSPRCTSYMALSLTGDKNSDPMSDCRRLLSRRQTACRPAAPAAAVR